MDAADLKVFETVARLGGIGRAAQALNTVQSNVTARVRLLEQELGTPLFERHPRGVTLTAAGRRLLPYAAEVKDLLARARRAAMDDGTPQGPLAIGTLETTVAMRLPRIIAAYVAAHPAVDLTLRTGTSAESVARVLGRELDGAFVAGPVDHADLAQETVFREELVVVTAPSVRGLHELAHAHALKLLVLRVGCSYRQRLETVLASRGIVDARTQEFGSLDAIVGCVAGWPRHHTAAAQCRGRGGAHRRRGSALAAAGRGDGGHAVHPPARRLRRQRALGVHAVGACRDCRDNAGRG